LRVLLVGLLAFVLVTQAAAAAMNAPSAPAPRTAKTVHRALTLDQQLERKVAALQRYRGTIRFFETHRSLLSASEQQANAKSSLAHAKQRVRQLTATVAALRAKVHTRNARRLAAMPPKAAICSVFGDYCQEAVAVAWCESRLRPAAQNGQYLGLFQMGSYERRLFGHGASAREQAVAAHRYFVRSGRDWSPWSCGWAVS
jgi:Lysozyme like domain